MPLHHFFEGFLLRIPHIPDTDVPVEYGFWDVENRSPKKKKKKKDGWHRVLLSLLLSHFPCIEYAGQLYNCKPGVSIGPCCIQAQNKSVIVLCLMDLHMEPHWSIVRRIMTPNQGKRQHLMYVKQRWERARGRAGETTNPPYAKLRTDKANVCANVPCVQTCLPACLCARLAVCGHMCRVSTEDRRFDKLIHSKHPDRNIPTGCFSSSTENYFAFQLPSISFSAFAWEMGTKGRVYTWHLVLLYVTAWK